MIRAPSVTSGIVLCAAGYAAFSLHDASNKWLVDTLPVWQVLFVRSLGILLGAIVIGRRHLIERAIATPLKGPLALRGLLTLTAWLSYYTAARSLPLAQMLSLYYAAPLMVTVMAIPLLGEKVTPARWASVGIGFTGVLIAADPFGTSLSAASALVLLAAALWGYAVILMRQIARRETWLLQMFASNLVFTLVTGVLCVFAWVRPTWPEILLLGCTAVFGGVGQALTFEAARRAPASVIAPAEYSGLIWAFLLGYLIWGDVPAAAVWVGAGLIAFAGALLFVMERRRETA